MKYFLLALSVVVIFAACSRTPQTPSQSRADILRTGRWKVSAGTLSIKKPNGYDTGLNYLNFIPKCHQDDYIVFDSQMHGAVFSGPIKCDPSDADSIPFIWQLVANNGEMDLYNGFNCIYGVRDSILPLSFDTLVNNPSYYPPLVLDTIHGVNDTLIGYTRSVVILDSLWKLKIDTAALPITNIYNAIISNFSSASFTLDFSLIYGYLDTTKGHMGLPHLPPIWRADTFKYSVTYSNF